jgi:hypothetical protein
MAHLVDRPVAVADPEDAYCPPDISRPLQNGSSYIPVRNDESGTPARPIGFAEKTAQSRVNSAGTRLAGYSPASREDLVS